MNLKQLSEELGVSQGTISRALNGYPDVSPKTRQRVMEAAAKHGYQPSSAARRLARGTTDAIAIVLPTGPGRFADPFFMEFIAGAGETLADAGLDLMIMAAPNDERELALYRRLIDGRRVDGFILARTRMNDPRINLLLAENITFVAHGRSHNCDKFAWFDVDGAKGFKEATERLISFGHTRIAILNASHDFFFATDRLSGYWDAVKHAGLDIPERYIVETPMDEKGGEAAAAELLAGNQPPTAFVCANDSIAVGACRAIRMKGWTPGVEVSVIGYDDLPVASWAEPPISTIKQPLEGSGARVAELLVRLLAGADPTDCQELLSPELVIRATDGPPPASLTNQIAS